MIRIPAEWEKQKTLLLSMPHLQSDWHPYIDEILLSYYELIRNVINYQHVTLLCKSIDDARLYFREMTPITYVQIQTNDTWIRDYGPIDIWKGSKLASYDFLFNAWGDKFESSLDNKATQILFDQGVLNGELLNIPFVLEGGSIDSNGDGVLLTTTNCLLNKSRNKQFDKIQIEKKLKELFGLTKIIWLEHGFLRGDDTDSHVDTLARFINKDSIVYATCEDPKDEHYDELKKMEKELEKTGFNLIPLPIPKPIFFNGSRLPATYINFIFINGAIIVPTYNDENDNIALQKISQTLPNLNVIGVDARVFIRQNGSLHCASMNHFWGPR